MIKVIKIGGKLIENDTTLHNLCDKLTAYYPYCLLVHGGGDLAAQFAEKLGVETKMHEGRRITDRHTLDITIMAYAGLANKKIVAALVARGVKACGLSGCDMNLVTSHKRSAKDIDWGYVGDIDTVDAGGLNLLLEKQIMPVLSPITCSPDGQLLNTNADSVASAVSIALAAFHETELVYCFDKPGVLLDVNDNASLIPSINWQQYDQLTAGGLIHSGMMPKLENAFKTIEAGVKSVRLTSPDNLDGGTVIVKNEL